MKEYRNKANIINSTSSLVNINNEHYNTVYLNGKSFVVMENKTGASKKFWLCENNDGKLVKKYLYKSQHLNNFESLYEVIYSRIGEIMNFPIMKSELVKFNSGNESSQGIIANNFVNNKTNEINLKILKYFYDNYNIKNHNTLPGGGDNISTYLKLVKYHIEKHNIPESQHKEILQKVKESFQKTAIIDFLLGALDRRFENFIILTTPKGSSYDVQLSPLFDNGFTIVGTCPLFKMREFNHHYKQDVEFYLYLKKDPAFSISPKSFEIINSNGNYYKYEREDRKRSCYYSEDLAIEISNNPNLYEFYKDFIKKVNIKNIIKREIKNFKAPTELLKFANTFHQNRYEELQYNVEKFMQEKMLTDKLSESNKK